MTKLQRKITYNDAIDQLREPLESYIKQQNRVDEEKSKLCDLEELLANKFLDLYDQVNSKDKPALQEWLFYETGLEP